jgi:hypothetical protein
MEGTSSYYLQRLSSNSNCRSNFYCNVDYNIGGYSPNSISSPYLSFPSHNMTCGGIPINNRIQDNNRIITPINARTSNSGMS